MGINFSRYKTYDTSNGYGSADEWKKGFNSRMTGEEAAQILEKQDETPHSILGVSSGATKEQIKAAFRSKIMEWHPDKNADRLELAEAMSKKIIAAYTILKQK